MYEKILVPVDRSVSDKDKHIHQAVRLYEASRNSGIEDCEIHGIFVQNEEFEKETSESKSDTPDKVLNSFKQLIKNKAKDAKCVTVYNTGEPVNQINRYIKEENIDLVVMATHNRSKMKELLLGSVTKKTIDKAPCPVLVVKK